MGWIVEGMMLIFTSPRLVVHQWSPLRSRTVSSVPSGPGASTSCPTAAHAQKVRRMLHAEKVKSRLTLKADDHQAVDASYISGTENLCFPPPSKLKACLIDYPRCV